MDTSKIQVDFKLIREHCIVIRRDFNTYTTLFNNENHELLTTTASTFFSDIAEILQRDWILQVSKLMDPAQTQRKKKILENLTVKLINEQLDELNLMTPKINSLSQNLFTYGKKLTPARNKRLAHYDREHQVNDIVLGATTENELHQFLSDIQEYCDLVGEAVDLGPSDFTSSGCAGDALDLLKVLNRGKNA
ncbi:hypothetical protein [Colwellia echini]|uniref:HEPN AbiU2-like domain-containing protein n=1 Tax=Colwellia echini TaxID=1982103 RepID=A0ABY3MSR5_9GAMM|nr:hypothetical protein [Colwellia echini]TYK64147.1 hypothetical protein CWS31_017220 [Colwellia echini]